MNNEVAAAVIAVVCGYLIGSFPTPYLMGRLRKGVDIREVGSRNMGAANVIYQVGLVEGILVLIVDVGKGAGAILLARVGRLVFGAHDPRLGACGSVRDVLDEARLSGRIRVRSSVRALECAALIDQFFRRLRARPA